jgi:hypothetical protein
VKSVGVACILALVLLWPPVQRVLVSRQDVNPWKLGGFAMYAVPTPPVLVAVLEATPGGLRPLDSRKLPEHARREHETFQMRRHVLGALHEPDVLARAVLTAQPELPGIVIAVQRMKLDRHTARMTSRRDRYVYDRTSLP